LSQFATGAGPSTETVSEKEAAYTISALWKRGRSILGPRSASRPRHVETRIQTGELDRAADVDYNYGGDGGSEFISHYVVPEDENARFGGANFRTIASPTERER